MSEFEFWHHHGGVSVPDLAEAIDWWDRVLGFKLLYRSALLSVPCEMAMLANGNLHIELFEVPAGKPPSEDRSSPDADLHSFGNKHMSFAVSDVDSFAGEMKRRGADIVWVKHFPNGNANIFIRDPFANLIEFVEKPKPAPQDSFL